MNIDVVHLLKDSGPISEVEALKRDHSLLLILHKDYIPTESQTQGIGTMDLSAAIAYREYSCDAWNSSYDAYVQTACTGY